MNIQKRRGTKRKQSIIDIDENVNEIKHDHKQSPVINWKYIALRYSFSLLITPSFLGLLQNKVLPKLIISAIELEPVFYLLLHPNVIYAKKLSAITYFVHIMETILVWVIDSSKVYYILALQCSLSNLLIFTVAFIFIIHPKIDKKLLRMCIAFSLRFIGVIWSTFISKVSSYYDYNNPSFITGIERVSLILSALLQIYLLTPIMKRNQTIKISKMSVIGKFGMVGMLLLMVGIGIIVNILRTTKYSKIDIIVAPLTIAVGIFANWYYYDIVVVAD